MKLIKYTVVTTLLSGVASAQGLFDINPNEAKSESSPLRYTAGVAFGFDDNVNNGESNEVSSPYVRANLGAGIVVRGEQTSWDLNADIGATNYFDDDVINEQSYNGRLALNLNHRINERLRFVSRNFVNYGRDLTNEAYGAQAPNSVDEYLYYSTDNAIGYRWTDRIATYTGITLSGLNYDGDEDDVSSYAIYNQFRYMVNQQTTLTATGRYTFSDFDSGSSGRTSGTVGVEHRLSDTARIAAQVGANIGEESTSAFGNLSYSNQINEQLRVRAFARYGQEDTDTVFGNGRYEDKTTLRVGAAADYTLSPQITLTAGGNYTMSDYKDHTAGLPDGDYDLLNAYVGATYRINDALSVRASANHTTSSDGGAIQGRDYSRNRYEVGVNYAF